MPVDTNAWIQYSAGLPAQLPDDAYNTIREQFYYANVAPELLRSGKSAEETKEAWMSATERPGKSTFPRAELVGKAALKGLTAPLIGSRQDLKTSAEAMMSEARTEAARQGVGPIESMGLEMVGEGVGMLPYFHPFAKGAQALTTAVNVGKLGTKIQKAAIGLNEAMGGSGRILATAPAIGLAQSVYDASKADDGHRVTAGLQGFALGAVGATAFEAIPLLRSKHNLTDVQARSVVEASKGTANAVQQSIADMVISQDVSVVESLGQYLTSAIQASKRLGSPKFPDTVEPGSRLQVIIRDAQGKTRTISHQDPAKPQRMIDLLRPYLDAGGEIINVKGDAHATKKLRLSFDDLVARGKELDIPGMEGMQLQETPTPAVAASTSTATKKIGAEDLPPRLEKLPNGLIISRNNGKTYLTTQQALEDQDFTFASHLTERPGAIYGTAMPPSAEAGATGMTQSRGVGKQPLIIVDRSGGNIRSTLFHENIHGDVANLGIAPDIQKIVMAHEGTEQLLKAFKPKLRASIAGHEGEELLAYLTSGVRTNNSALLDPLINQGTPIDELMMIARDLAYDVIDVAKAKPDSLHQRRLISRMEDVISRSGATLTVHMDITNSGHDFYIADGKWHIYNSNDRMRYSFNDRNAMYEYVRENYRTPETAPNLVDEVSLPEIPKAGLPGPMFERPLTTDPINPIIKESFRPMEPGVMPISAYLRPFYAWLSDLAAKVQRPEIYNVFKNLDTALIPHDNFLNKYEKVLVEAFKGMKPARYHDMYRYMETPTVDKPAMAKALHMTQKELDAMGKLRTDFFDPLAKEFNIPLDMYIQDYVPRWREHGDPRKVIPQGRMTQAEVDVFFKHARTGELDGRETDLLKVASVYLRLGVRDKFVEPGLKAAADMINAKNADGTFIFDPRIQSILKRHIETIRGRPDASQQFLNSMIDGFKNLANEAIATANKGLPGNLQLAPIEMPSQDILGRMMLYSYAGTLGARPMAVLRDSLQYFLTTYPILGAKYTVLGMTKGFSKAAAEAAEHYGALVHRNELANLYAGGFESLSADIGTRASHRMLALYELSNNKNRVMSFWAHSQKALDAIQAHPGDAVAAAKGAGLQYLDKPLREAFVKELQTATPNQWQDIAYRIGKEMTDISQWNYRRGANPALYKTAVGRILGQYGTWPLNYVEYLRRVARSGDSGDKVKAMARWGAAHYAILKLGEAAGIDTGSWVFASPASFAGSPALTAATNVMPAVSDFATQRGTEARDEMAKMPFLMVPGGLATKTIIDAVTKDKPDLGWIMLGFDPLDENDMKQPIHKLP